MHRFSSDIKVITINKFMEAISIYGFSMKNKGVFLILSDLFFFFYIYALFSDNLELI